jgi:hypothetical protein
MTGGETHAGAPAVLLQDQKHFWIALSVLSVTLGLAKGLRLPNLWAATQAQVDYRFGFVKRGLFGALLGNHLELWRYGQFAKLSLIVFVAVCVLFALLLKQSGVFSRLGAGEAAALLLASFVVPCIANLDGYLDIVLLGLALGLLLVRDTWLRFALALPISIAALLIHESYLLIFLPVVLCSFLFDVNAAIQRRLLFAGILSFVCLMFTVILAGRSPLSPDHVQAMTREVASRSDYPIREDFFGVMRLSLRDNLMMMRGVRTSGAYWLDRLVSAIIFYPVIALLLRYAWQVSMGSPHRWFRRWGFISVVAVTLAALGMHQVGWDVFRFDAWCCCALFLALLLLIRAQPLTHFPVSRRLRYATLLVIVLSANVGVGLLDVSPRRYPFVSDLAVTQHEVSDHRFWAPPGR